MLLTLDTETEHIVPIHNDRELVARARKGDTRSGVAWLRRHQRGAAFFARFLVSEPAAQSLVVRQGLVEAAEDAENVEEHLVRASVVRCVLDAIRATGAVLAPPVVAPEEAAHLLDMLRGRVEIADTGALRGCAHLAGWNTAVLIAARYGAGLGRTEDLERVAGLAPGTGEQELRRAMEAVVETAMRISGEVARNA